MRVVKAGEVTFCYHLFSCCYIFPFAIFCLTPHPSPRHIISANWFRQPAAMRRLRKRLNFVCVASGVVDIVTRFHVVRGMFWHGSLCSLDLTSSLLSAHLISPLTRPFYSLPMSPLNVSDSPHSNAWRVKETPKKKAFWLQKTQCFLQDNRIGKHDPHKSEHLWTFLNSPSKRHVSLGIDGCCTASAWEAQHIKATKSPQLSTSPNCASPLQPCHFHQSHGHILHQSLCLCVFTWREHGQSNIWLFICFACAAGIHWDLHPELHACLRGQP